MTKPNANNELPGDEFETALRDLLADLGKGADGACAAMRRASNVLSDYLVLRNRGAAPDKIPEWSAQAHAISLIVAGLLVPPGLRDLCRQELGLPHFPEQISSATLDSAPASGAERAAEIEREGAEVRRKLDELGVSRETSGGGAWRERRHAVAKALVLSQKPAAAAPPFPMHEGNAGWRIALQQADDFLAMFDALDLRSIFNLMASAHERAAEAIQTIARSIPKSKD